MCTMWTAFRWCIRILSTIRMVTRSLLSFPSGRLRLWRHRLTGLQFACCRSLCCWPCCLVLRWPGLWPVNLGHVLRSGHLPHHSSSIKLAADALRSRCRVIVFPHEAWGNIPSRHTLFHCMGDMYPYMDSNFLKWHFAFLKRDFRTLKMDFGRPIINHKNESSR